MKRIYAALSVLGLALAAPFAVCQAKVTTCEVNLAWDAPQPQQVAENVVPRMARPTVTIFPAR